MHVRVRVPELYSNQKMPKMKSARGKATPPTKREEGAAAAAECAGGRAPLGGGVESWTHKICNAFLLALPRSLGVP